jgi:hypothetical protein
VRKVFADRFKVSRFAELKPDQFGPLVAAMQALVAGA